MFVLVTEEGGAQQRLEFSKSEISIGRVQGNDIILSKRNVSKKHAQITIDRDRPIVADLGSTNGTWVNGHRINAPVTLKAGDKIYIADFILTLDTGAPRRKQGSPGPSLPPPPPASARKEQAKGAPSSEAAPASSGRPADHPPARASLEPLGSKLETEMPEPRPEPSTEAPSADAQLETEAPEPRLSQAAKEEAAADTDAPGPKRTAPEELVARLSKAFDMGNVDAAAMAEETRWSEAQKAISEALQSMKDDGELAPQAQTAALAETILHEAVGLGVLDGLLSDAAVREILVQGTDGVLVDRGDGLEPTDLRFSSAQSLEVVAARLAAQTGGSLGEQTRFTGHLSFGPLVNILRAPLALRGPVIEIRMTRPVTLEALVQQGWLTSAMADYLGKAVSERRNILVTGARGAGVTTLVSALANGLSASARTVVAEAVPDLQIDRQRVVSLVSQDSGISLSEVIERAGRMRAEHLVIDDVSAREAWSALSTLSEREPGHIVGLHARSAQDPVHGVTVMTQCSGAPGGAAAELVANAVDLVVAMTRTPGATRVNGIFQISRAENGGLDYAPIDL